MPHSTTLRVRFSELDPYDHVNHAAYVTYFEVARTEALEDAGLPIQEIGTRGYQFVVTEINVRFVSPAIARDTLTIETWITKRGRASMRWSQRIMRGDQVLVTEELRVAITDRRGRPTRPPSWIMELSGDLDEPAL